MLTKEQLQENLADLEQQHADLMKDQYAVVGAIQNTHYLIGLCDSEPAEQRNEPPGE